MDLLTHVIEGRLPLEGGAVTLQQMKDTASSCISEMPVDLTYTQALQVLAAGYGYDAYEAMLRKADHTGLVASVPPFSSKSAMSRAKRLANPAACATDAGKMKMLIAETLTTWTEKASDSDASQWKPWCEYLMTNFEVLFHQPDYMDVPTMRLEDYYFNVGEFDKYETAIRYLSEINFEPNKRRYHQLIHGMSLFLLTRMPKTGHFLLCITNPDGTISDRFAIVELEDMEMKSIICFDGITKESCKNVY